MIFDEKRGQSTIFIIAGIAIVVIIGLVVFFTRTDIQVGRRITTTQVEPIKEFVESCVREELETKLKDRMMFGGRKSLDFEARSPLTGYNVLNIPINNLPSLPSIEGDFASDIVNKLAERCSLNNFKGNFDVVEHEDEISVRVEISDQTIIANVVYPITVKKDDFEEELKDFNVILQDKFGTIHNLAREIVNGVIENRIDNIANYCADFSGIICSVVDNRGGLRLVFVGNEKDLPKPSGENFVYGNDGDIFVFVLVS